MHLDKILDYLTLEELVYLTAVSKLFCFVATLDRLYTKFGIQPSDETYYEESLWDENISDIYTIRKLSQMLDSKVLK